MFHNVRVPVHVSTLKSAILSMMTIIILLVHTIARTYYSPNLLAPSLYVLARYTIQLS